MYVLIAWYVYVRVRVRTMTVVTAVSRMLCAIYCFVFFKNTNDCEGGFYFNLDIFVFFCMHRSAEMYAQLAQVSVFT